MEDLHLYLTDFVELAIVDFEPTLCPSNPECPCSQNCWRNKNFR
jgi:hypothetical protein